MEEGITRGLWQDSYHQGRGHAIDQCTTLQHAIQDIIDRGSMSMNQLGVVANPLKAHFSHMVPSTSDPHSTSRIKEDDT